MNDSWKLLIIDGPDRGRSFSVAKQRPLVIGRGTNSDTQIRDPRLSRVHCEIRFEGNRFVLADCGSSSGTLMEGRPILAPQPMGNGTEFQIGDSRLRLESDSPLDATTISRGRLAASPLPPISVRPMPQLVGETFYRYRLDKLVAPGKCSAIFKGYDTRRERVVAVKILKPQMASTETQQERFIRAMRTMLPIRHPNIVRLYKAGRRGPYCWAALEWVEGVSIAELIEQIGVQGMLDWKEVWRVAVHIGRALDEASRRQIVHRNITPSNILRRNEDRTFLLADLILARALENTDAPQLTRPGEIVGELAYIAPERILDPEAVDGRSDQYGLGATLYTLLTGQPPYDALGVTDLIEKLRTLEPRPPTEFRLGTNERFSELVLRLLRKSPDKRFPSIAAMLHDLERVAKLGGIETEQSK